MVKCFSAESKFSNIPKPSCTPKQWWITYEEWAARGIKEKLFELFAFPVEEQL